MPTAPRFKDIAFIIDDFAMTTRAALPFQEWPAAPPRRRFRAFDEDIGRGGRQDFATTRCRSAARRFLPHGDAFLATISCHADAEPAGDFRGFRPRGGFTYAFRTRSAALERPDADDFRRPRAIGVIFLISVPAPASSRRIKFPSGGTLCSWPAIYVMRDIWPGAPTFEHGHFFLPTACLITHDF